jgi:hypothetical protein
MRDKYPYEATWKSLTPQQQREAKRRANRARLPIPDILRIHYVVSNPIPIMYRANDPILHTPDHPFCMDMSCGCHDDLALLQEQAGYVDAGLLTSQEFLQTLSGKQI